jgi:hypothetical protein
MLQKDNDRKGSGQKIAGRELKGLGAKTNRQS